MKKKMHPAARGEDSNPAPQEAVAEPSLGNVKASELGLGKDWDAEMQKLARQGIYVATSPPHQGTAFVGALCQTLTSLRDIRDTQSFLTDGSGAHSFREWCVIKFGERLGCWLDDYL